MTTTTETCVTVSVPFRIKAHEIASAILESGFETYDWHAIVDYVDGYGWQTDKFVVPTDPSLPFVRIEIDDPFDDEAMFEKALSLNDLVKAFEAVSAERVSNGGDVYVVQSMYGTDIDIDASFGDSIVQHAVLGEVVYG